MPRRAYYTSWSMPGSGPSSTSNWTGSKTQHLGKLNGSTNLEHKVNEPRPTTSDCH